MKRHSAWHTRGAIGVALLLVLAGTAPAQLCDPEDMPPPAAFADTLLLPGPDWEMIPFYPVGGTRLDEVDNAHYTVETEFRYFGIPAEPDDTEEMPAHYFLPIGWRTRDMLSFRWARPASTQIVRAPSLRSGGVWVPDPAGSTPADTVLVSPRMSVYGRYTGSRDQVFTFEYSFGARFQGDRVLSPLDPDLQAWSASSHTVGGERWYDTPQYFTPIGGSITITSILSWKESYGPDIEHSYAPGDARLSGRINLYSRYTRVAADSVRLDETNIHCAHGLFPDAWYPSGTWNPETDPSAYGLYVSFSPGVMGDQFRWRLVVEEIDGYLVWRELAGSGEGWVNIWKISYNEERDKEYWWWIGGEFSPTAPPPYYGYDPATLTPVFAGSDELLFLDFDVHNGFAYNYAITTFDRGFRPNSGENNHYLLSSTPKESLHTVAQSLVFNKPADDKLERSVYAVPNPLRSGKSAFDDPNYHNFPGAVVRFVGVTAQTTLRVYSLAGDLLFEAENRDPSTCNIVWDTRNQQGELVASGVYLYRAEGAGDDEEYGRLVIIR
ncbi:hypothetical protein FJ251_01885 [bacterium]|nr:hypothetical protein [bacterium]